MQVGGFRRWRSWGASVRLAFAVSVAGTVLAGSVLAVGSVVVADASARATAEHDVGEWGTVAARVALASHLTDEALAGDPVSRERLDRAGRRLVEMTEAEHVKIWDEAGRIVWADEPQLVGQTYEIEAEDRELFGTDRTTAHVSSLDDEENWAERPHHDQLLEVYAGITTAGGQRLLFESYYPYDLVDERAAAIRQSFLPLQLAGLGVLTAIELLLSLHLAGRLTVAHNDRERLLERLIETGDSERRRIAAEVHDGAVQDLIGVSFSIAAAAEEAPPPLDAALNAAADSTRTTVRSLRSLLTSVYPVEVPPGGLADGLADLVGVLTEQGIDVDLDLPGERFGPVDELLLLRAAREALRNVAAHAGAERVVVRIRSRGGRPALDVVDDGVGFTAEEAQAQRTAGHLGLSLLRDLAADAGAFLRIESSPGEGTRLELVLAGPA